MFATTPIELKTNWELNGDKKTMKQKYQILKNVKDRELIIREYAVLSGSIKRKDLQKIQEADFSLLCEQTFDTKDVKSSISEGKVSLISFLRTRHFFPISLYMDKIADTVIAMFAAKGDQCENLIFDDKEFIYENKTEAMIEEEIEDEDDLESSEDLDDVLKGDINIKGSVSPDNTDHEPFDEEKS